MNNSNYKGLPLCIVIYRLDQILYSCVNKTKLINYKQFPYMDIYDSNVFL